jgi:hypothetical protein
VELRWTSRGLLGGDEVTTGDAMKARCTVDAGRLSWTRLGHGGRAEKAQTLAARKGAERAIRERALEQAAWCSAAGWPRRCELGYDVARLARWRGAWHGWAARCGQSRRQRETVPAAEAETKQKPNGGEGTRAERGLESWPLAAAQPCRDEAPIPLSLCDRPLFRREAAGGQASQRSMLVSSYATAGHGDNGSLASACFLLLRRMRTRQRRIPHCAPAPSSS